MTDDAPKETPDRMATPTDELPIAGVTVPIHASRKRSGTTGILTAVLVIMAVVMVVAQIISAIRGQPGPGPFAVSAHVAGAVAGIWCYRKTISTSAWLRRLTATALPLITAALLWFYWWS